MAESAFQIDCQGSPCTGILHHPEGEQDTAVLIVVGGPQTRVGSHRLFVHLARSLAKQGIVVFRFDYSGAGDSEGDVSTFTGTRSNERKS